MLFSRVVYRPQFLPCFFSKPLNDQRLQTSINKAVLWEKHTVNWKLLERCTLCGILLKKMFCTYHFSKPQTNCSNPKLVLSLSLSLHTEQKEMLFKLWCVDYVDSCRSTYTDTPTQPHTLMHAHLHTSENKDITGHSTREQGCILERTFNFAINILISETLTCYICRQPYSQVF